MQSILILVDENVSVIYRQLQASNAIKVSVLWGPEDRVLTFT